ncbi:hypothetical protein [Sporolactobacillus terrae]|uniref:hypothetical protein n=1 Tax=Sporolactobacillus terrae TaxID=269673 RepID=UPI001CC0B3CA|nr:hypothetical protein [Sporolactobacillus terrae]UAK16116.1 hypothetical protein K7399_14285 [Sporolactobacillus terrae]
MARRAMTLDENIEKLQEEVWGFEVDRDYMKLKDQVMDSGFVLTESEIMDELSKNPDSSIKSDYFDLLKEMKIFYGRVHKQQENLRIEY